MALQELPYVFLFSSLLSLFTAHLVWRRKSIPAARTLTALLFSVAAWTLFDGLESLSTSLQIKVFCSQMTYVFLFGTVILFFRFALEFTGQASWITRRRMLLVAAIPILTVLITFTNSWHHLNWSSTVILPGANTVIYGRGPWFWVHVTYTYGLYLVGLGVLIRDALRQGGVFRTQAVFMIPAALIPVLVSVAYLARLGPYPFVDFTSVSFLASGVILNFAMLRFRFLDLMPVARHMLVENMTEGVIVLDAKYRIVDINPQAAGLFRLPPTALGATSQEALPAWFPLHNLVSTTQDTMHEIATGFADHQDIRVLRVNCTRLPSTKANRLGWLVLVRDVTDRVQAENELKRLNNSLESQVLLRTAEIKAEQERADAILRSMGDALAAVDLDHRITFVNPLLLAWTGYSIPEIVGQPIGLLGLDLTEILAQSTLGRVGRGNATVVRRNGTTYPAALVVAPIRMGDHEEAVVGFVVSHADRSQELALEHARSRFITSISHELRTPVTNIRLYSQLLAKAFDRGRDGDTRRYMGTLDEQIQQLQLLIQDILLVVELESEPHPAALPGANPQHQPLSPHLLFVEVLGRLQSAAIQKEQSITLHDAPPATPNINGHHERLIIALGKIVENAVRYTPAQGKIDLRIRVNGDERPGWVGFQVQDTGVGLSERDKEHAFDHFYRGEIADDGAIPGSGLGLSIAAIIARNHHGHVDLAGAAGEGARVTLWLPIAQGETGLSPGPAVSQGLPGEPQRFSRLSKPKPRSTG